jgi:hypothetical protein
MGDFAVIVWLVIRVGIIGQPLETIEDSLQPDIPTCISRASEALEDAAKGKSYSEFFVQCSIVPVPQDPA